MGRRVGGFRTPEAAERYSKVYDEFLDKHWTVPWEELDVPTRFGPTHVRRSGPKGGTPLVMIHPTTGSSLGWHPLIPTVAARHRVYTPDTIGTAGRSVQEHPIETPEDLSMWLDDVLDALDLDTIHLLGYSEGGWIAGVHAAHTRRPDRIATLTLIEPAGAIEAVPRIFLITMIVRAMATLWARDKRKAIRDFNRWLNGDNDLTADEIDLVLTVFGNYRQRLPTPKRLTDQDLGRITMPTLLLLGEHTRLFDPHAVADRARKVLPDVTVDITPGAGHGLVFQHSDRTVRLILDFVSDHA